MTALLDFASALDSAGLSGAGEIIPDGKVHRFTVDGDRKGSENGWYFLFLDSSPYGEFGSWKTGQREKWFGKLSKKLTKAEREAIEERAAIREREHLERQREASKRATSIWVSSPLAPAGHLYLEAKGIKPGQLRLCGESLVVPMADSDGNLTSLQFIHPDGTKKFLTDGKIDGSYCVVFSKAPDPAGTIAIAEGYATASSIHAATEIPVVCAFNAGNLSAVSRRIRAKYPAARIVICADNDQFTDKPIKNPGVHYATIAAAEIRAHLAVPEFQRIDSRPTDFNDLAILEGLPRVAEIIDLALSATLPEIATPAPLPQVPLEELAPLDPADGTPCQFWFHVNDWPISNKKGLPIGCIENVKHLIDKNGIQAQYDVIRKDISIRIPVESYLIDTEKNDKMTRIISLAAMAGLPTERVPDFVSHIASQNPYNPVAEWITSKPWDGASRLKEFYSTVSAQGDEDDLRRSFKETILKRWMISAIAAAFRPDGVSAHGILVFKGDQYIGKTNWFKSLVPQALKVSRDGMILDPKDKDSVYQVVSNWMVELGELDATFKKADIAQLKAFITKDQDTIRLPYARFPSNFARRTVFFGSVNENDYLSDPTGNRRFWTIDCRSLNHTHGLDMQQIWAEFYALYLGGEGWFLSADEMLFLNAHNRNFEAVTAVDELIAMRLSWDDPETLWTARTATEIAFEIGIREPNEKHLKQVGKAIRDRTSKARTRSNGRYLYTVPVPRPIP